MTFRVPRENHQLAQALSLSGFHITHLKLRLDFLFLFREFVPYNKELELESFGLSLELFDLRPHRPPFQ